MLHWTRERAILLGRGLGNTASNSATRNREAHIGVAVLLKQGSHARVQAETDQAAKVKHEDVVSESGGATSPPAAKGCGALLPRCRGDTKWRPASRSGGIRPDRPRVHLPGRDGTRPARCVRSTVESAIAAP